MTAGGDGRIRVAHLIHTIAYGGVETTVLNWVGALDPRRFEARLFCFANPGATETPFVEAAAARGLAVERIRWSRRKPVLRAAREMATYIRTGRIDILHCHNSYAQLVAAAAGRLSGAKTITTFYVWGSFGWKRAILQWADLLSARFIDEISAHSKQTAEETIRRGIAAGRVRYIPSGCPVRTAIVGRDERSRRRRELGAGDSDIVLVNVARFWPEKAHQVLLEAFRMVRQQHAEALLWLAGSGPGEAQIRAAAKDLNVERQTLFLGFRRDVPELLALADIQVHPSDMEGVPLAVCEGMAAGLPVVATEVGGLVEILENGRTGILVPPRRPYHLAQAVLDLIEEPGRRIRLGEAARRYLRDEYSVEAAASRLAAVYEEMMAR